MQSNDRFSATATPGPPRAPQAPGVAGATEGTQTFKALNWLLFGLILSFPFYLFGSGGPQISSAFGFAVFLLTLPHVFRLMLHPLAIWGVAFVAYTMAVNGVHDVMLGEGGSMLKYSVFYAYNLVLFMAILRASEQGQRFFDGLYKAVLLSIAVQAALAPLGFVAGTRNTLFFNNPNQLGYWALLSACLVALLNSARRRRISRMEGAALLACLALVGISQSKAAIGGMALVIALRTISSVYGIAAAVLIGLAAMALLGDSDIVQSIQFRMAKVGVEQEDTLFGRGYGRIVQFPEYIVLGAGEGGLSRFGKGHQLELHSVPAMLLFSYGFFGVVLILTWVISLLRRDTLIRLAWVAPLGFYLLTHQGMRFSLLWVVMAVVCVMPVGRPQETAEDRPMTAAQRLRQRVVDARKGPAAPGGQNRLRRG